MLHVRFSKENDARPPVPSSGLEKEEGLDKGDTEDTARGLLGTKKEKLKYRRKADYGNLQIRINWLRWTSTGQEDIVEGGTISGV